MADILFYAMAFVALNKEETELYGIARLVADPVARRRMGEAGLAFTVAHQGATARTMRIVERVVGAEGQEKV